MVGIGFIAFAFSHSIDGAVRSGGISSHFVDIDCRFQRGPQADNHSLRVDRLRVASCSLKPSLGGVLTRIRSKKNHSLFVWALFYVGDSRVAIFDISEADQAMHSRVDGVYGLFQFASLERSVDVV